MFKSKGIYSYLYDTEFEYDLHMADKILLAFDFYIGVCRGIDSGIRTYNDFYSSDAYVLFVHKHVATFPED